MIKCFLICLQRVCYTPRGAKIIQIGSFKGSRWGGKFGKVGKVEKVGKVGKVGNVGKVVKVGKVGKVPY